MKRSRRDHPLVLQVLGLAPLVAAVAAQAGRKVLESLSRRKKPKHILPDRISSAEKLCGAILGNPKSAVADVFGPPRASAGFSSISPALLVGSDYQHAETWYYPLDAQAQLALAVSFEKDIAREARVVRLSN